MTDRKMAHGHTKRQADGQVTTPTYRSWSSMRTRCKRPSEKHAKNYRDRGITICKEWDNFSQFLLDMGERPEGTSLDRYPDVNGNYEPGNCRWATVSEQARNTTRTKLTLEAAIEIILLRWQGFTYRAIAAKYGISESLPKEIVNGRSWAEALDAAKLKVGEQHV